MSTTFTRQMPIKKDMFEGTKRMTSEQVLAKRQLSKVVLLHPEYDHARRTIMETIEYNYSTEAPEPSSILVLGESGAGKTTLRDTITEAMEEPYEEEIDGVLVKKIPFFDSSVHTTAKPEAMSNEILRHMGMGEVSKSGAIDRVRACLKRAGTFAFNYDEIHNLAGDKSPVAISRARNWLRDLITNTGVMVIGYGTPDCKQIFLDEPQLLKRFPIILELRLFDYDLRANSVFRGVLGAFEEEIGSFSNLLSYNQPRENEDFFIAMYAATGGSINAIKKIYEQALTFAFKLDGRLDIEKFALAMDKLTFDTKLTGKDNPFREMDRATLVRRIRNAINKRGG